MQSSLLISPVVIPALAAAEVEAPRVKWAPNIDVSIPQLPPELFLAIWPQYRKSGIFRLAKFPYNKFPSILIFVHLAQDQWKCLLWIKFRFVLFSYTHACTKINRGRKYPVALCGLIKYTKSQDSSSWTFGCIHAMKPLGTGMWYLGEMERKTLWLVSPDVIVSPVLLVQMQHRLQRASYSCYPTGINQLTSTMI